MEETIIQESYNWIEKIVTMVSFGGILLTVIGYFARKKLIVAFRWIKNHVFTYTLEQLEARCLSIDSLMESIRNDIPMILVDDNATASSGMVEQLKEFGYNNISPEYPITMTSKKLKECLVAIVDVNDVYFGHTKPKGDANQGLSVARIIKQTYPCIKVISYTGNFESYKDNAIYCNLLDGRFEKDAAKSVIMRQVDSCIAEIINPAKFLRGVRNEMIEKKFPLKVIQRREHDFVKRFIHNESITLGDIVEAMQGISDSSPLAKETVSRLKNAVDKKR